MLLWAVHITSLFKPGVHRFSKNLRVTSKFRRQVGDDGNYIRMFTSERRFFCVVTFKLCVGLVADCLVSKYMV